MVYFQDGQLFDDAPQGISVELPKCVLIERTKDDFSYDLPEISFRIEEPKNLVLQQGDFKTKTPYWTKNILSSRDPQIFSIVNLSSGFRGMPFSIEEDTIVLYWDHGVSCWFRFPKQLVPEPEEEVVDFKPETSSVPRILVWLDRPYKVKVNCRWEERGGIYVLLQEGDSNTWLLRGGKSYHYVALLREWREIYGEAFIEPFKEGFYLTLEYDKLKVTQLGTHPRTIWRANGQFPTIEGLT